MTSSIDGTATYSYDTTNQVPGASYTGTNQPANEAYSFDKNGNRTNTGFTTGTNNQLTSDGAFNYTYDHQGNRVTRTRISSGQASDYETTYAWDYRNRLTDVEYFNNSGTLTKHVHYVYDVYDHLIGMQFDATGSGSYGSSEWYALDLAVNPNAPALPVLQFNGSGNETYRFLNGPGAAGVDAVMGEEAITTQGSAGTTTYALADNLGSVRDIVNTSSVVVDHIVCNSFGNVVYESGTVAHWAGYAGYHPDANTGLDYADHRWYDPAVGRWISEDPLGFRGGDTNVSRYVGNAATIHVDPTGLSYASDYWYYAQNIWAGMAAGTAAGAGTGAATGAAGGALAGGVGAGPGAVGGAILGGIGGFAYGAYQGWNGNNAGASAGNVAGNSAIGGTVIGMNAGMIYVWCHYWCIWCAASVQVSSGQMPPAPGGYQLPPPTSTFYPTNWPPSGPTLPPTLPSDLPPVPPYSGPFPPPWFFGPPGPN